MPEQPINLKAIPDSIGLPMFAAKPRILDWSYKSRLTPAQIALLAAFNALNFSRKAQLLHGMKEGESIPALKIKLLYEEQMREGARGADAGALKDTTRSDIA